MAIGGIASLFSQQITFIWLLIFIVPIYLIFANLLAKGIQLFWQMSQNRNSSLYKYLGDISWLFPLRANESEFKLVHIIMIANLIALISIVLLLVVVLQNQFEKKILVEKKEEKKERKVKTNIE